jgi:hypothetical protein
VVSRNFREFRQDDRIFRSDRIRKIWVLDFLTESESSGEGLLEAARRVSGSELINRIDRILRSLDRRTGFSGWTGGGRIKSLQPHSCS